MDSPVQIPFKSFIQLDANDTTPIYLQLVFQFIKAIQLGLLPEGTKLPGTRVLCQLFSVNRNTLIKAFHDLESQGFISIVANKGTFILNQKIISNRANAPTIINRSSYQLFFERSSILEDPAEKSSLPLQFDEGFPDTSLSHTDVLARLYVSKLKRNRNKGSSHQLQELTRLNFRKQFSNYLNLTRGLKLAEANLLISTNHEISLYLVLKLLISKGDKVVVAAPGYYRSNMTILDSGAEIFSIPVDEDGINTDSLRKLCMKQTIRAVYLTSLFHYPTNALLSAKRRIALLELANEFQFVIIEDDYDFEFHFDNNSLLPLAAMSSVQNIIYIGSFAKALPTGFGYGFVSAASDFISELKKHQSILEPEVDIIKEQVLSSWIEEGEVHRLTKKNKKIYKERRDHFISLLMDKLDTRIKYTFPSRGLAVWIEWLDHFNLVGFKKLCAKKGLFLPQKILYQNKNITATRLGFGSLNEVQMNSAVEILHESLMEILKV